MIFGKLLFSLVYSPREREKDYKASKTPFIHLLTHSFKNQALSAFSVPDTDDTMLNETDKVTALKEFTFR